MAEPQAALAAPISFKLMVFSLNLNERMPADIKEEGPFPSLPKFPASSLVASHSRLSPARRVDGEVCGLGPRPQAPLASASFCRQGALRAGWTAEGRDRCFYRCFFRRPEAPLAVEAASVVEPAAALE